jgi:hypothetical protein
VLALDLPGGPALLRIVRVHVHRRGETPSLEELRFSGIELPTLGTLATLEAKIKDSIAMMSPDARLFALPDLKNAGWKEAGFRKVATIPEREGDSKSALPSFGVRWSNLVVRYRQRASPPEKSPKTA